VITDVERLAAFPAGNEGGNPAGVVVDATGMDESQMLDVARAVGYSETAFLFPQADRSFRVRYFSPEIEVDFCGHATIATGVALGQRLGAGEFTLITNSGPIGLTVVEGDDGFIAELTSAPGYVTELDDHLLHELLRILGFTQADLDPHFTPMVANAGNSHPVLVLGSAGTLTNLAYDFDALQVLSRAQKWPTVLLVAQEGPDVWRARNPFAFGGVYEDPATGSAAAAFGVYLRETGHAAAGDSFQIRQGVEMGQPCLLSVTIDEREVRVSGGAIRIDEEPPRG
jgi:PhzF family phenazine biosynthesis protein